MTRLRLYAYRRGVDFELPPALSDIGSVPILERTRLGWSEWFTEVDSGRYADFLVFPHRLGPVLNHCGWGGARRLIRALPRYGLPESRAVLWRDHDGTRPLGTQAIVFAESVHARSHDRNAVPTPFFRPASAANLTFDEICLHTTLLSWVGGGDLRQRLTAALLRSVAVRYPVCPDLLPGRVARPGRLYALFAGIPDYFHWLPPALRDGLMSAHREAIRHAWTTLCPRGVGQSSARFFEVLAAGRIPVLLADTGVLPLTDRVEYDNFMLRIPERDASRVPEILANWLATQTTATLRERCEAARQAWHRHFQPDCLIPFVGESLIQRK